jgi:hypothetical protein
MSPARVAGKQCLDLLPSYVPGDASLPEPRSM